MGLRRALLSVSWPAAVCGFFNVLSAFALVLLTKLVLLSLTVSYPATIALAHNAAIAAMLWFWTLFGMFKPRRLSPADAARLAAPHAAAAVLAVAALQRNSLSVYAAARLTAAPTVFLLGRARAAVAAAARRTRRGAARRPEQETVLLLYAAAAAIYASAAALTLTDHAFRPADAAVAVAATTAAAVAHVGTLPLRRATSATELQLQLYSKTATAAAIAIAVPFVDDYSPASPASIWRNPLPEHCALLTFLSALLAFLSFVSMRAAASRSTTLFYLFQALATSAATFAADRYLFYPRIPAPPAWCASVAVLLLSAGLFSCLRDVQLHDSTCADDDADGEAAAGEETAPLAPTGLAAAAEAAAVSPTASWYSRRHHNHPQQLQRGDRRVPLGVSSRDNRLVARSPAAIRQHSCGAGNRSPPRNAFWHQRPLEARLKLADARP